MARQPRPYSLDPERDEGAKPHQSAEDEYLESVEPEDALAYILRRFLVTIPPKEAEALVMLLEGISQRDAATLIGCSHRTVARRAERALVAATEYFTNPPAWVGAMAGHRLPAKEQGHLVVGVPEPRQGEDCGGLVLSRSPLDALADLFQRMEDVAVRQVEDEVA